ncbi:hypothetical protein [Hyalangium rubrum]|uniref:Lipoprotein n=1 Tax=Hyalangium rubrum TaxID=3103134 RepID=A0ABU5H153_9BACT|nr:hypothetical protein [Hyalangium sp. s54d21]MDY7226837.1 hypothetical protein [Hyalangium sp. s54d21]
MSRALLVLMLLGCSLPAMAQAPSGRPREIAGVCGTANWVCVSECIDSSCMENCLRQGCEEALKRLEVCTAKAGCAPDDTACSARVCGKTCQKAFEPAPPSPEKEKPSPCTGFAVEGGKPPKEVVGRWVLSAATLTPKPKDSPTQLNPEPRADYERILEVTPEGCFLMRTKLEDATLGRGNALEVRAWGSFAVTDKDKVALRTKDGQAVGPVCNKPRVIGLSKGKFQGPHYSFSVEDDTLTLVAEDPSKRTFQFQREKPEDAQQPPAKP